MVTKRMVQMRLEIVMVLVLAVSSVVLGASPTDAGVAPPDERAEPRTPVTTTTTVPVTIPPTVPAPPVGAPALPPAELATPVLPVADPPPPVPPPPAPLPSPLPLPDPLELARAEVAGPETRYTTEWGFNPGFWCAKFVSWVLAHAGVAVRHDGPAALRHLVPAVETPVPGDLVFIDLVPDQHTGQISHVGIVETIHADGSVGTIEGNADRSGLVTRQVRRGAEIVGFGRPPAPTSATVIPAPAPPTGAECVWIEIGKPWLCDWKPLG